MKYVYILESISNPERFYTGLTKNIEARLKKPNEGLVRSTASNKPWRVKTYLAFSNDDQAVAFEAYLKSGSGRAFAKKRL